MVDPRSLVPKGFFVRLRENSSKSETNCPLLAISRTEPNMSPAAQPLAYAHNNGAGFVQELKPVFGFCMRLSTPAGLHNQLKRQKAYAGA